MRRTVIGARTGARMHPRTVPDRARHSRSAPAISTAPAATASRWASSIGGRSRYRNVGRTRRQGAEVSLAAPLARDWDATLAYTWLDATFRDGFASGAAHVAAGTRLPATARQQLSARLQWHRGDWQWGAEGLANAGMTANDAGTARAAGYGLLNLEASHGWRFGMQRLRAFARIENVFDRAYIGSVIVNDGNGRFFESALPRNWMIAFTAKHEFR